MDIDVCEMSEMRVAAIRHTGPYNQIGAAFSRLGEIAGAAGLLGPETVMLGIYHDDPNCTPADELRSDAAVVVPEQAQIPDGLTEQRVPAGRYACATHIGPYEQLGEAWARFVGEWLPQNGHRTGEGLSYEIYRNHPGQVPSDQLRTELYLPLA